jgi:hypothetical protein
VNNNTKARWKKLTKRDRRQLALAGAIRKSKKPKVGGRK